MNLEKRGEPFSFFPGSMPSTMLLAGGFSFFSAFILFFRVFFLIFLSAFFFDPMFTSYDGQKKWGCCFFWFQAMIKRVVYFSAFLSALFWYFFLKLFFQRLFSEFFFRVFFRHNVRAAFFDFHIVGGVPAASGGGGFPAPGDSPRGSGVRRGGGHVCSRDFFVC